MYYDLRLQCNVRFSVSGAAMMVSAESFTAQLSNYLETTVIFKNMIELACEYLTSNSREIV